MQVSYIITTFNRHELLERAVAFVARERCADSELIVVDDNSQPPAVMPLLAETAFPGAHQLIRNSQNLGVIGARNAGLQAATGQYVVFLDDDDESLPNRTVDLLAAIKASSYDFVAARSQMVLTHTEKTVPAQSGFLLTPEKLLLYPSHIDAIIWRRETFVRMGGLDNRVPYFGEHISLLLCLLQGGSGWLSEAIVARFGYIDAGLTLQTHQQNRLKELLMSMFRVLQEEATKKHGQHLFDQVLTMLQREEIVSFDNYLLHLHALLETENP